MEESEIQQAIRENAQGPRAATGDSGSFTQHSIQDQIAADQHLANTQAAQDPFAALRIGYFRPAKRGPI